MKRGNELMTWYYDGALWKTFSIYSKSDGISYSVDTETVSSKAHGLHPSKIATTSNGEISGSGLMDVSTANMAMNMAKSGQAYSFCFGNISQTDWQSGLKSVTDCSVNTAWTPGTGFINYADGLVTSVNIQGQEGAQATVDWTISLTTPLSATAPTTPTGYTD